MPEVSIPLKIVGAGEDYPRLLTAYRSIKGTQVALVLRPTEGRVVLAITGKDGSGHLLHATALDTPTWPTGPSTATECLAILKEAQKSPPKAGPIVMRGQWRGKLHVDIEAKRVRVELVRKIASYGTLTVIGQSGRWTWRFERAGKWFSTARATQQPANANHTRLSDTIRQAYSDALDLVGQACGTRDTRRRQALDADYATRYPIRPPRDAEVSLDRFKLPKPKKGRAPRKKAGSCDTCATDSKPLGAGGPPIPVAHTAPALEKQADALKADAEGLATTEPPKTAMSVDAVLDHFNNRIGRGYHGVFQQIHAYAKGTLAPLDRTVPLDEFIAQLREAAKEARAEREASWRRSGDDAAVYAAEDEEAITALDLALRSAPVQLARARQLIRFAQAAADSPKCSGPEEMEARKAILSAEASYETARKALVKGGEKAALKAIRQSAAWLALSASKIASSCKVGQKSLLGHTPTKAAPPTLTPGNKALVGKTNGFVNKPSAATAKAWVKLALEQQGITVGKLTAKSWTGHDGSTYVKVTVIPDAEVSNTAARLIEQLAPQRLSMEWEDPAPKTPAAKMPGTARKSKAPKAPATPAMSATDAALMAAFQQAIASAVSGASA